MTDLAKENAALRERVAVLHTEVDRLYDRADRGELTQVLIAHDAERMSCMDHEGLCCPAGDAHNFTSTYAHQAEAIRKHLLREE